MSPVLPGAEPFDHPGGPVGVLLCHGFTGSPQTLRGWADYLDGQPSAAARARHYLAGSRPDQR
jgi:esterase/lipase